MTHELIGHVKNQTLRIPLAQGVNPINRGVLLEHGHRSSLVSRSHAEIEVSGSAISIRDLGSRNGTLVNGQPVKGWQRLHAGDRVAVGDVELLLRRIGESGSIEPTFATWLSGADEVSATSVIDLREVQAADRSERMRTLSKAGELLVRADPLDETIAAFMDLVESEIAARRTCGSGWPGSTSRCWHRRTPCTRSLCSWAFSIRFAAGSSMPAPAMIPPS